jgi:hypothetical protein
MRIGSISIVLEGEAEGVGDGDALGLGEIVGVGFGVAVGVGDTFTAGLIATPLFQSNLLPCFTQVYKALDAVLVVPILVHFVPAIVAGIAEGAFATKVAPDKITAIANLERFITNFSSMHSQVREQLL